MIQEAHTRLLLSQQAVAYNHHFTAMASYFCQNNGIGLGIGRRLPLSFVAKIGNSSMQITHPGMLTQNLGKPFAEFGNGVALVFEREFVPDVVVDLLGLHINQVLFT